MFTSLLPPNSDHAMIYLEGYNIIVQFVTRKWLYGGI